MTEPLRDQRVQESGVVGHSYDTDDRLGDVDIYEALVNPHEEHAGGKTGAPGGPTMMPMGGAGSGSGASSGSAAAGDATAGGAAKGTSAASAGAGRGVGVGGTSGAGVGVPGFGASGHGGDGLSGGGGASLGGLGTGGLPGSSWGALSSGTGAAGMTDPTVAGAGADPGSTTGEIEAPSLPVTPAPTIPTNVSTSPRGSSVPISTPTTDSPSGSGITAPSVKGGGAAMPSGAGKVAGTSGLGATTVTASPEMLHQEALHWDDTSRGVSARVTDPIGGQAPSSVDFGMMKDAFGPYNDLLTRLKKWSAGAVAEFSAISDALQAASGGYYDTDATNTAAATGSGTSRPE